VIVIEGTTGFDAVKELGPRKIVQVKNTAKGFSKLLDNEADAVVFDYPFLVHAAHSMRAEGKMVKVVGQAFTEEFIAIPMSPQLAGRDPALVSRINRTILELRDEGYIENLKHKYIESLDDG
jgi:ABC-type amino acid transport substrate-binding protein